MGKLKTAFVILLVVLACQAAFAGGFTAVGEADSAVTAPLAAACDVLLYRLEKVQEPVAFLMEQAGLANEQIDEILYVYGINGGYESLTTNEELAVLFPRGVEASSAQDAYRRAAIHLAARAAKGLLAADSAEIKAAEERYSLVGYDFLFTLTDDTIVFRYLDVAGKDEVPLIASALMKVLPGAVSFTTPKGGEIDILTPGMTERGFKAFVRFAEGLIYETIY